MSATDKLRNFFERAEGQVKETAGRLRGDKSREHEGRFDQAKADAKQAGEKAKDAFRH